MTTIVCEVCGSTTATRVPGWCAACNHHARVSARDLLWWLVDGPVYEGVGDVTPDPLRWDGYPQRVTEARAATQLDEAVMVATGRVQGTHTEAMFVAWDFAFLGGTMGMVVGETIAMAYEKAARLHLPVVLLPATGGARMQEGMASLVQMAATSVAATAHSKAGLLQVAVLRDPTTGGVFASHANLAHIILAEPDATIGFAGPRVAAALTGGELPEGSHTSAGAHAAGLIDAIVSRPDLPATLGGILGWHDSPIVSPVPPMNPPLGPPPEAWDAVQAARAADRPRASAFLNALDVDFELHGDRAAPDDPTIRVVLARLAGRPIVVVALDSDRNGGAITAAGYRKAWRGFKIADTVGAAVVTLIDTTGADASGPAEAGGIAHHIARTFAEMLEVRSPVISVVIGEGGSGGALALSIADRLLIQERATYSVIAPEGAAAILHRDASRAAEVAEQLSLTARKLYDLGIADEVIPEPDGEEIAAVVSVLARHLDELAATPWPARVGKRRGRWRHPLVAP